MSKNDRAREALTVLQRGGTVPDTPGVRHLIESVLEDAAEGIRFPDGLRQMASDIRDANPTIDPYEED